MRKAGVLIAVVTMFTASAMAESLPAEAYGRLQWCFPGHPCIDGRVLPGTPMHEPADPDTHVSGELMTSARTDRFASSDGVIA
jgi:hypothetical protein